MDKHLQSDRENLKNLLETTLASAWEYLETLNDRPVGVTPEKLDPLNISDSGQGAEHALKTFMARYESGMSGSPGPRYWGFVTGGSTPASLMGDWLASTYDQNITQKFESAGQFIEEETIRLLVQLFNLTETFTGIFVSGATMSNFSAFALARQWWGKQQGVDISQSGFGDLPRPHILSATPHTSATKALSMLGFGRESITRIPTLPGRESMDMDALEEKLKEIASAPAIVIASAGTVNTVDFDDLKAVAALKEKYNFWFHLDGAFGGFAAASPDYAHLVDGMQHADSICIDGHKWLNVPYDSAMMFTPHSDMLGEVFSSVAVYLGNVGDHPDRVHQTPQNSRRFRALPAWFTLMAYGRAGVRDIVERNCEMARLLADRIDASESFTLMAPVIMNVVCFTLNLDAEKLTLDLIRDYLRDLQADGKVFMTPTTLDGVPGIRAAISNWRTEEQDVDIAWESMDRVASAYLR